MSDVDGGREALPPLAGDANDSSVLEEAWSKPGAMLGDRYVVERRIGSGGMGYVVAARHSELGEQVAIKLILPGRALSEEARNRLVREARAAAKIKSAHVVRIFDVVSKGPGAPYLVMEYLGGETLGQLLERSGRLTVDRAVEIIVQTCEPLAEAHRNGTVHRDLKPSNLFLTDVPGRPGFVKVLDFGIAKTAESGASLTQSHALLASPAYASPEQLRASKEVDSRSDVWSLGVILYECLTGRLPFGGRALAEISSEILRDPPQPPSVHRSDLPSALERVILRCLEKEPAQRFESVETFVVALEPFAPEAARNCLAYIRDLGDSKHAPSAEAGNPIVETSRHRSTLTHASVASSAEQASPKRSARRLLAALGGVGLLLVAAANLRPKSEGPSASQAPDSSGSVRQAAATSPPPALITSAPVAPATETPRRDLTEPHPMPQLSPNEPRKEFAPARTPKRRAPDAPPAQPERRAPSPLETLPLNDLIDGRK